MTSSSSRKTQRIKVAVCGEVNSGKTSFLNALRRGDALPDFSGTKTKPTVKVVFGAESEAVLIETDDNKVSANSLEDVPTDGSVVELEVHATRNELGNCEVIEFPSLRDGHVTKAEIEAISACDILVWLTIGSQAWRLSEKTIINKLPNRKPEHSVLVVSRADKFRSTADQDRLAARLESETSEYFEAGAMLCADPDTLVLAKDDDAAWEQVGGKAHTELLAELVKKVEASRPRTKIDASEPSRERGNSKMQRPRRSKGRGHARTVSKVTKAQTETAKVIETPSPEVKPRQVDVETEMAPPPEKVVEVTKIEASVAAETQFDEMKRIVQGLDGLLALTSFDINSPDDATAICGDASKAKDFAKHLAGPAEFLAKDTFFEDPEWVHISAQEHQILYRIVPEKNDVLLLACRSSNPGIVRNTFMRISKS